MAKWDIKVMTARSIITKAAGNAAGGIAGMPSAVGYTKDGFMLQSACTGLGNSLPNSPLVCSRLNKYLTDMSKTIESIGDLTHSALQGTADAVSWYNAGDLQMAANANKLASQPHYPVPPGKK